MESFFALLQKNILNTRRWETREELRLSIVTWIETTYSQPPPSKAPGEADPGRVCEDLRSRKRGLRTINPSVNQTGGSPACPVLPPVTTQPAPIITFWQ